MKRNLEIKISLLEDGYLIESEKSIGTLIAYAWGKKTYVAETEACMKDKVEKIIDNFSFNGKKKAVE